MDALPAARAAMVPTEVAHRVEGYLCLADRLLRVPLVGCYLVGSVALGGHRPGRSDIDLVTVLDTVGPLRRLERARLRTLHVATGLRSATAAARRHRSPLSGTCNAVYISAAELTWPVTDIFPLYTHIGTRAAVGRQGSDVSPVAWHVLRHHGIAVRGAPPAELGLDVAAEQLDAWNRANLEQYWRPWARRMRQRPRGVPGARHLTAWGVLGVTRLHATISTGTVITKEDAGRYGLERFEGRWHDLLRDALAHREGRAAGLDVPGDVLLGMAASFVDHVIDDALALPDRSPGAADPTRKRRPVSS